MLITPDLENQQWISMKMGDQLALKQLFNAYNSALYNYCRQFTTNEELVKDAIQELFISIWLKRETLTIPTSPRNYLYRSIRNNLLRQLSTLGKSIPLAHSETYPFHANLDMESEWIEQEKAREITMLLQSALEQLTNRQRRLFS